ncbi:S-adenosyl-L-methionine-dependent methyltransferase [Endogone sp. FLAS-F59071]|nr:S-adenosyl-L-methionine-dependent methyltransferase [Endogone sp. FLAS-F59071]|eukprot:RUS13632.1 S-adenosyl-L-methionine-dependent methyltransferase [Endogone sp. FLAS-F59071]
MSSRPRERARPSKAPASPSPPHPPPKKQQEDTFAEVLRLVSQPRATTVAATAIAFAAILQTSPRYLEPVYGNVLPFLHLVDHFLSAFSAGALIGAVLYVFLPGKSLQHDGPRNDAFVSWLTHICLDLCAFLIATSPTTYRYLFAFSSQWGPTSGPVLTQLVVAHTASFLLGIANALTCAPRSTESTIRLQTWIFYLIMHANLVFILTNTLSSFSKEILGHSCQQLFGIGVVLSINVAVFKALLRMPAPVSEDATDNQKENDRKTIKRPRMITSMPTWKIVLLFMPQAAVVLSAIFNQLWNPQCASGLTPQHNPPSSPYFILARTESITGWLSVVEELPPGRDIRLLRAGHSILGGIYRDSGDSVFGSFYFMEAVRLVERKKRTGSGERALQIGLGAGISTNSLQRHNVSVDIVELDPAVYNLARDFFNIKPVPLDGGASHRAFFQDGRQFLKGAAEKVKQIEVDAGGGTDGGGEEATKEVKKRVAAATAPLLYDYVLHDVFTGGSLPVQLFSVEALRDIKIVLKKDGNFVGSELDSEREPLDILTATITAVFPYVECFREPPPASSPKPVFENMVFFASTKPLTFRAATEQDYLGSTMRRQLLSQLTAHSVFLNLLAMNPGSETTTSPKIATDSVNLLAGSQVPVAIDHWRIMREVFPVGFWLNY